MKSLSLLVLAAAATAQTTLMQCNANNCLRAVRATNKPERSASELCASFLRHTVTTISTSTSTIYTSTTVVTATASATETTTVSLMGTTVYKRTVLETPTAIPAYASACDGAVKYSSACQCIGATATTVTVADPTETAIETATAYTTTVTETAATTTLTAATVTATAFAVQLQDNMPGKYLATNSIENVGYGLGFTDDASAAAKFVLQPDNRVTVAVGGSELYYSAVAIISTGYGAHYMVLSDGVDSGADKMVCAFGVGYDFSCNGAVSGPLRKASFNSGRNLIWVLPDADVALYDATEIFHMKAVPYAGSS